MENKFTFNGDYDDKRKEIILTDTESMHEGENFSDEGEALIGSEDSSPQIRTGLINCQYVRQHSKPNLNIGRRMVVTAGYIPLKIRIENMVTAGINLQEQRELDYPGTIGEEELDDDMLNPDIDEIDVMNAGLLAEEKLNRRTIKRQDGKKWHSTNTYSSEDEDLDDGRGTEYTEHRRRRGTTENDTESEPTDEPETPYKRRKLR